MDIKEIHEYWEECYEEAIFVLKQTYPKLTIMNLSVIPNPKDRKNGIESIYLTVNDEYDEHELKDLLEDINNSDLVQAKSKISKYIYDRLIEEIESKSKYFI